MLKDRKVDWGSIPAVLESAWAAIPKAFRHQKSVRRTMQCVLFRHLEEQSLKVVADYTPPRMRERCIDLLALDGEGNLAAAICLDELVTLHAVKALECLEVEDRVIFTTGLLRKKVDESRFFLRSGIQHYHVKFPKSSSG